jgi:hypothetical protein
MKQSGDSCLLPDYELVSSDRKEYVALDQYCGPVDAHLALLPVKEGNGVLETIGLVNVDCIAKVWQPVKSEALSGDGQESDRDRDSGPLRQAAREHEAPPHIRPLP